MPQGIFITGNDTGIGKTVITAGLARILLDRGLTLGVMKPVQTGAAKRNGEWVSEDMEFIKAACAPWRSRASFSNPYLLRKPLSPHQAAKAEKVSIKISRIRKDYEQLAARCDVVLLEGAGGLLVPLNEKEFMADLALTLDVPLIVVARPRLGAINHTLLTIQSAWERGLKVLGIVFNYSQKDIREGEKEAMDFIRRSSGAPILGTIPHIPGVDVAAGRTGRLASRFRLDLQPILDHVQGEKKKKGAADRVERLDRTFVWHPFTQMREWTKEKPLMIEGGEGSYLIDVHGKRYLDGVSSLWVTTHGHRKMEINRGIKTQLNKIAHSTLLGLGNVPAALLAEKLVEVAPKNLRKVFYSDSGATAVEVALKMAYQYWRHQEGTEGRRKFVYLHQSYHGDTLGSMGVGGIDLFHDLFRPLLFDSFKVPNPYCYRCPLDKTYPSCKLSCADEAEKVLRAHSGEIAAFIMEPMMQGAAGMIAFPKGYLKKVAGLCEKYRVLLIADEVATGFGRTGKMFACEHEGVRPDILCLAKGITGGYLPLAATLTTQKIFSAFLGDYKDLKTFFHGHTYTGNPLACAAALENLALYKKEKTLEKMRGKIELLKKGLAKFKELKYVGDIRQQGFMVGIELVRDKATKEPFSLEEKAAIRVTLEARRRGVVIRPLGNVVVLVPHLSFSREEIKTLLQVVYESIQETLK